MGRHIEVCSARRTWHKLRRPGCRQLAQLSIEVVKLRVECSDFVVQLVEFRVGPQGHVNVTCSSRHITRCGGRCRWYGTARDGRVGAVAPNASVFAPNTKGPAGEAVSSQNAVTSSGFRASCAPLNESITFSRSSALSQGVLNLHLRTGDNGYWDKLLAVEDFFFYVDQFEQSSGPGHHPMLSTLVGGITYKRGGKVAGHGSCMAVVCKVSPVPS